MSTLTQVTGKDKEILSCGIPCSFAVGIEQLSETDPELVGEIEAWLAGERPIFKDADIYTAFQKNNITVARSTISRHRRRECRCAK